MSTEIQPAEVYLAVHPNAVVDSDKARVMADASKYPEIMLRHAQRSALYAASSLGNPDVKFARGDSASEAAALALKAIKFYRKEADRLAHEAGKIYDQIDSAEAN